MTLRLTVLASLSLAACTQPGAVAEDAPVDISVIGPAPRIVDPTRSSMPASSAVLLSATAQGLVRFDASGQIEPGLAIRWDVSDDGLYYTFRLAPGAKLNAEAAARRLRSAINGASRNPLKQELSAVAEIVAVTDEVIEIRLRAPRPDLLSLLAQPELALIAGPEGSGPFRVRSRDRQSIRLVIAAPPASDGEPQTGSDVILRGESAGRAVARFAAGLAGVVLGGDVTNIAIARAGDVGRRALRIDPAAGLFGLEIVQARGLLATPEYRRALAMAMDRDRIVAAFVATGWTSQATLVPSATDEIATPAAPDWVAADLVARADAARTIVAGWHAADPAEAPLRVAVPAGSAGRLLYTLLAIDWRRIGVESVQVAPDAPADLRLLDRVAPTSGAAWYLHRFTCDRTPACSTEADSLLAAARDAPTLQERAALLAEADRRLAAAVPFIPIATPLRWSLVAPNLTAFRENARNIHPLDELRGNR